MLTNTGHRVEARTVFLETELDSTSSVVQIQTIPPLRKWQKRGLILVWSECHTRTCVSQPCRRRQGFT